MVIPVDARPQHGAPVAGQIGPVVVIEVLHLLPMHRSEQRVPPAIAEGAGDEAHGVRAQARGLIHQDLRLTPRLTGHEVDDPAKRRSPVESRSRALDDFDPREVQGWHLHQAEPVGLRAIQRQLVDQDLRVTAAQPLEPQLGAAEGRNRRLHAQPSEFVEQGREVAWSNRLVLLDLFLGHRLDADRLILDHRAAAGRGNHGDLSLQPLLLKLHDRHDLFPDAHAHRERCRSKTDTNDADRLLARRQSHPGLALHVGLHGKPTGGHVRR